MEKKRRKVLLEKKDYCKFLDLKKQILSPQIKAIEKFLYKRKSGPKIHHSETRDYKMCGKNLKR